MKDEILAAAADKICDLLTCSQSTTNRTSSSLTQSSSPQGIVITLLILSSVFLVQPFLWSLSLLLLFLFNRLRSGWIIILLAWQNGLSLLVCSLKPNLCSFLFCPGLSSSSNSSWPLSLSVHKSPFCTVFLHIFRRRPSVAPSTAAACTSSSWPACTRCPRPAGTRTGCRPKRAA